MGTLRPDPKVVSLAGVLGTEARAQEACAYLWATLWRLHGTRGPDPETAQRGTSPGNTKHELLFVLFYFVIGIGK